MNSNRFQRNRGYHLNNQARGSQTHYTNRAPPLKRKREDDDFVAQSAQFPKNNSEYYQEPYKEQSKINEYDQPSTSSNAPQTSWNWSKTDDFQSNTKKVYEPSYIQNKFSENLHYDEQQSRFSPPKTKEYYKNIPSSRGYGQKYSANSRLKLLRENITKSISDETCNQGHTTQRPNYTAKPSTMQARISKYNNPTTKRNFDIDSKLNNYISHTTATSKVGSNFTLPYKNSFESDSTSNVGTGSEQDDIEYMDWSSIDVQEVLVNLEDIRRNNKDDKKFVPKTPLQHTIVNCSTEIQLNKNLCKTLYIVIDTNIFISNLILVKQLLKLKINGVVNPILYIPWMVIQELDYLKDGRSGEKLKRPASWAVKFINKELSSKNPQLQGQSVRDAAKVNLTSKSPDDGILFCLLQIVESGNRPYLLSNDVNLRNKAILNEIEAYGQGEILKELDPYDNNKLRSTAKKEESEDIKEIKMHLSNLFSFIILKEVRECTTAPPIQVGIAPPPWTLLQCLNLFKSYWATLFNYKLQKQCINTIENFVQLIKEENYGVTNGFKENLLELGLGLCIYIKNGLTKYSNAVNDCIMKLEQDKEVFLY